MAIIKKYNKENGTTYVYDSVSYWDKEKQQPRSKRKLIGKLDPISGEIVPTGSRGRRPKDAPAKSSGTSGATPGNDLMTGDAANADNPPDYRRLYEESRRKLLEKESSITTMEATISRLSQEKKELVAKLEQLVLDYKC